MNLTKLLRKNKFSEILKMSRYYHPSNCGRALMGNTEVQEPPKHYYLYTY